MGSASSRQPSTPTPDRVLGYVFGTTTTSLEQATASDAELIVATRAGSDEAFSTLYRRHVGAARAAARTLLRSRTAGEDLVAEGFTRILVAMRRGAGPEVAFRPYLLTCIRNAAYDRYRRERRVDLTPDAGATQPDLPLVDPALLTEERHMIARAFTSLPDRWQAVLWHTEIEGLSAAAVAPILGLSPNAVSALHYRAREGLRQAFLQAHLGAATPETCRASRSRLGRYVRNALSPTEQAGVDRHLETCERCRVLLSELTDVDTSLRSAMVPLVVGAPAGAYLAGLSAGGLGAAGLGVGGLGAGLAAVPALKIGLIAASVLAVAGGVALAAYPDRPSPPTATTATVVAGGSAGEEGGAGDGGTGAESSSATPGAAGDPADQGAPGATSPGGPTAPGAATTTVPGGALPLTASPSQATGSGVPPTGTAPAPVPPPPTAPSLSPPPVAPPLPTTLPTLPITLPTLPPLPTTLPTLPPLPTTLPTLPPLPTTLPTLPPLPTTLPTLPTLP